MADLACPCGQVHELSAKTRVAYENVAMGLPPTVLVSVNGRAWQVPHIYMAAHGLRIDELPALAERFGWPEGRIDLQGPLDPPERQR